MLGPRVEASDLQRMGLLRPRGRTEKTPTSVVSVEDQSGCEGEVKTQASPSPDPAGGPGQVWPHVGPLSTFCADSGLILVTLQVPKGEEPGCAREEGTTREPREDHPPHNWGYFTEITPPTNTEGSSLCSLPPKVPLHFSHRAQEPGGKAESRPESIGQRVEGGFRQCQESR